MEGSGPVEAVGDGRGFAEGLLTRATAWRDAVLTHPFVCGLGDGSLPPERYRLYLRQDYVFLREYARVLALAVAAAQDPEDMAALTALLHATLHGEMDLHRAAAAEQGIGAAALERCGPAPFTFTYTSHLLAVARGGTLGEIVAALLPCQWGYAEIGTALARRGRPPVPAYAAWVEAYAGAEYQATARWVVDQGRHLDGTPVDGGQGDGLPGLRRGDLALAPREPGE